MQPWKGKLKPTKYKLKGYAALEWKVETYQVLIESICSPGKES
jgi:hypothetical protein